MMVVETGMGRVERVVFSTPELRPLMVYVSLFIERDESVRIGIRSPVLREWVLAEVSGGPKGAMDVLLSHVRGRQRRRLMALLLGQE